MSLVERVARRFQAAVITPRWVRQRRADLRAMLTKRLDGKDPGRAALAISDLQQFWKRLYVSFIDLGVNDLALRSIRDRVETQVGYLESVERSLRQFDQACYLPNVRDGDDAIAHVTWQIRYERLAYFEEWVETLSDALKYEWSSTAAGDVSIATRILAKATSEEIEAIRRSEDYSSTVLHLRHGFWQRVGLRKIARRTVSRRKLDWDPMKRLDFLFEVLDANYTQQALDKNEMFSEFDVGDLRVIVVDPEIAMRGVHHYAARLIEARRNLEQAGLSKLWYGTLFIKSDTAEMLSTVEQERYRALGYEGLESRAGSYHSGSDVVVLNAPPSNHLMRIIVHEMGHRYWFKFMTPEKRARFNALVRTNPSKEVRDFPSGPLDDDGREKPIAPVSDYGASTIEEAFAEAFEHLVNGVDMTRDQATSLRSVFAAAILISGRVNYL